MVTLLLIISIVVEQFFVAPIFPMLSSLGSIRPMIVFLDIPLPLPVIDIIPVTVLFSLFYFIAPSSGIIRNNPSISQSGRVWKALTGLGALLILLLAGGGLFYLAQDYMPKNISNGIDSFGVRADLTLPYPSGGLIHLHGSVVMLLFSAIGVLILRRRTADPIPVAQPVAQPQVAERPVAVPAKPAIKPRVAEPAPILTTHQTTRRPSAPALSSSLVSTTGDLISPSVNEAFAAGHTRYLPPVTTEPASSRKPSQTRKPEPKPESVVVATAPSPVAVATPPAAPAPPASTSRTYVQKPAILPPVQKPTIITPEPAPTCRLTTPPPIAMVMPRPAPGVGKMHPCYVVGGLKPTKGKS
ncbi:hypothetical protein GCM10011511_18690 [Puia dinghuensis]|uniref:Uncharacterized protein n=2 Tax=Puia dinghuensis TaxID=1792502 RepID=A0A8J2UC98_9BACT|nr:hypothetical protein GCM10011511_18690 [Puia dinghuensis]